MWITREEELPYTQSLLQQSFTWKHKILVLISLTEYQSTDLNIFKVSITCINYKNLNNVEKSITQTDQVNYLMPIFF